MAFRTLTYGLRIVCSLALYIPEGGFDVLTEQLEGGYFVKRCPGTLEKLTKNVTGLPAWHSGCCLLVQDGHQSRHVNHCRCVVACQRKRKSAIPVTLRSRDFDSRAKAWFMMETKLHGSRKGKSFPFQRPRFYFRF